MRPLIIFLFLLIHNLLLEFQLVQFLVYCHVLFGECGFKQLEAAAISHPNHHAPFPLPLHLQHMLDIYFFSLPPNPCYHSCIFICMVSGLFFVSWPIALISSIWKQLLELDVATAIPQSHSGNCHFYPRKGHRAQSKSPAMLLVI